MADWKAVGRFGVANSVATIAERSTLAPNLFHGAARLKYIEIITPEARGIFTLEAREGAIGNDIFVAPGSLGLGNGESRDCHIHFMSEDAHRRRMLLNTRSGRVALVGLFLAVLGFLLDVLIKVFAREIDPISPLLDAYRPLLFVLAGALQVGGVCLAFWRTFRRGDY